MCMMYIDTLVADKITIIKNTTPKSLDLILFML